MHVCACRYQRPHCCRRSAWLAIPRCKMQRRGTRFILAVHRCALVHKQLNSCLDRCAVLCRCRMMQGAPTACILAINIGARLQGNNDAL